MREHKISQRRVCDLVDVDPKTVRRARPPDHADVRKKMHEIAGICRRFGYRRVGIRWFRSSGGMPPTHLVPSAPVLTHRNLTFSEREKITLERARGTGIRAIARKLGRSPSTISREIKRNSATRAGDFDYRAITAQWHADRSARRPKPGKLARIPALRDYVQDRLSGLIATPDGIAFDGPVVLWKGRRAVHRQSRRWSAAWSREQIAQRLKLDFPEDLSMRISHEAIYQSLYIQGRGALRRDLSACLRSGRALRLPRGRARNRGKAFIADALMISDRPAEVADRASGSSPSQRKTGDHLGRTKKLRKEPESHPVNK